MADRDNADRMGDNRDTRDKPDSEESGLSAEELAARLGVSPRTIRRWARAGKVSGETIRGARGPELRFSPAAVERPLRQAAGGDADTTDSQTDTRDNADSQTDNADRNHAELRQALAAAERRIAGAQQAARVMALRLSETRADLERERQRAEGLAEELAALRQELRDERDRAAEREQQHATAERELRVLLLRASESLAQALTTHQALTSSRRRAWWRVWDR